MAVSMRAKVRVTAVKVWADDKGEVFQEDLVFNPVARNDFYPDDGTDEDNTFAKFSPSGEFCLTVANPALLGKFAVGEIYYVDFSPVP